MLAGRVTLQRTWLERYLREPTPTLELRKHNQALTASAPPPGVYLHGRHPERYAHLPWTVGRFPLGPFLPRYARALRRGLGELDNPGLDWSPPPPPVLPARALANAARHTNFNVGVTDGNDTPLIPADPLCCYLLIVNNGANDALIGFDKSSDDGLLLQSGGGFHELVFGTRSSVRGQGNGGATTLTIVQGRSAFDNFCRLPCD